MTKALVCARCTTIRTLLRDGQVTTCECGTVKGWWVDAGRGVARLYTEGQLSRHFGRFVGFHNTFLAHAMALDKAAPDVYWRSLHERATEAPGYMFDLPRRACWAVIITPGETNDTRWATDAEWEAKVLDDAARGRPPLTPAGVG